MGDATVSEQKNGHNRQIYPPRASNMQGYFYYSYHFCVQILILFGFFKFSFSFSAIFTLQFHACNFYSTIFKGNCRGVYPARNGYVAGARNGRGNGRLFGGSNDSRIPFEHKQQ